MKRATLFILSVCFLLSISACAGSMQSLSKAEIWQEGDVRAENAWLFFTL
jgi:hypothetical protein